MFGGCFGCLMSLVQMVVSMSGNNGSCCVSASLGRELFTQLHFAAEVKEAKWLNVVLFLIPEGTFSSQQTE